MASSLGTNGRFQKPPFLNCAMQFGNLLKFVKLTSFKNSYRTGGEVPQAVEYLFCRLSELRKDVNI
jgi:hypothetical protein